MKKVLVVGAGSGIGKSLFSKLKSIPHIEPVGISRRGENFKKEESLVHGQNYKCDLRNENDIVHFTEFLRANEYFPDAVYFTSGDGLFKPIAEISSIEWDDHFSLNVRGVFLFLKELHSLLQKAISPIVCFIASTASRQGFANSSAYCASKHALLGLARAIREEWKAEGIRITSVVLGAVDTPIWDDRPEFSREDMIPPEELSDFLVSLLQVNDKINLDEIVLLPKKGIL